MVRPITGFMTNDNVFYEVEAKAQLHEATKALEAACYALPEPVKAATFIRVLEALADQCGDYLSAYEKVYQVVQDTSSIDRDQGDNSGGGRDTTTLEQFEVSGYESLPDMGHSPQAAAIRSAFEVDGARVRRNDARSVRSYKDMAVRATPEDEASREGHE